MDAEAARMMPAGIPARGPIPGPNRAEDVLPSSTGEHAQYAREALCGRGNPDFNARRPPTLLIQSGGDFYVVEWCITAYEFDGRGESRAPGRCLP